MISFKSISPNTNNILYKPVYGVLFFLFLTIISSSPLYAQEKFNDHFTITTEFITLQTDAKSMSFNGNRSLDLTYLGIEHGLPNSHILSIFEDNRKTMWFGTAAGIVRYDGSSFCYYEGLPDNIYAIESDNSGRIWFGGGTGLVVYDGIDFYKVDSNSGFDYLVLSLLYANDKMYIGTSNGGLFTYSDKGFKQIGSDSLTIKSLLHIKDDKILIGTIGSGLLMTNINDSVTEAITDNNSPATIYSLLKDNETIWVGTNGAGVFSFSDGKLDIPKSVQPFAQRSIYDLNFDNEHNLFIATDHGLGVIQPNKTSIYTVDDGLCDNLIYTIEKDSDGFLWFGSYGNGINKSANQDFCEMSDKVFEGGKVYSIISSSDNSLWFACEYGLLVQYKNDEFSSIKIGNNIDVSLYSIEQSDDGSIWFGTANGGLFSMKDSKLTEFEENFTNESINSILSDSNNDLWIATNGDGIFMIKNNRLIQLGRNEGLDANNIMCLFEDSNGRIWAGSRSNGVFIYDGKKFRNYNTKNGLSHNNITCIFEDRYRNIWIGTHGKGVDIYDNKRFTNFSPLKGKSNNTIRSLIQDEKGNIWIGTDNGVNRVMTDNAKGPDFQIDNIEFKHFGYDDGFSGNDCLSNSVTIDTEGNIWWGTSQKLIMYNSIEDKIKPDPPILKLKDIYLFFKKVMWKGSNTNQTTGESQLNISNPADLGIVYNGISQWNNLPYNLELPYDQNHLTFDFFGTDHNTRGDIQYKFKLHNHEKSWCLPTTRHEAIYSELDPGKYTFKVMARSLESEWSSVEEFSFNIIPPWWLTWWFRIICGVLVVILIYVYIKLRERKLLKRQKILEDKVDLRTKELKEAYHEIEEINSEITDSIKYARQIQKVILPSNEVLTRYLKDSFMLYLPRDYVSGDFYWYNSFEDSFVVAVADCTGHGVPGAFMSMLGMAFLNEIVNHEYMAQPDVILRRLRKRVIKSLKQKGESMEQKDGMDMAICTIDIASKKLQFAGANNPLYIIRDCSQIAIPDSVIFEYNSSVLYEVKGDNMPIAIHERMDNFKLHEIEIQPDDCFYLISDGFPDQFGGPKGKKFKYKPFKRLLMEGSHKSMDEQFKIMSKAIDDWKAYIDPYTNSPYEQVDDISLMGFKVI